MIQSSLRCHVSDLIIIIITSPVVHNTSTNSSHFIFVQDRAFEIVNRTSHILLKLKLKKIITNEIQYKSLDFSKIIYEIPLQSFMNKLLTLIFVIHYYLKP